ncbi:uncharacterized protein METZ01_LOCUS164123 [marine metagenome]|uniref:Uncharacterized protein n=1 Tax=marine metagenome TaxID=408172 RepID=A0A382BCA8_9ZZZZ
MELMKIFLRLWWLKSLPRRLRWRWWIGFPCLFVFSFVVMHGNGLELSPTSRATAANSFSVEEWVARNLVAKALSGLFDFLPGQGNSDEERESALNAYFALGNHVRRIEASMALSVAKGHVGGRGNKEVIAMERQLDDLRQRRDYLSDMVEQNLENTVASVLRQNNLDRNWGPFKPLFPPVSFQLDRLPKLIVVSAREHIATLEVHLLKPELSVAERDSLEATVGPDQNRSALVIELGGLATFPSLVSDSQTLRFSLQTIIHEWLHQYFFFHALGQSYYDSANMTTLNETAADIGGKELGDLAFVTFGGEIPTPIATRLAQPLVDGDRFEFNRAMGETRMRTDELLGAGLVDEAEAYMEERRKIFVDHGYPIRVLNQAYFAFHGTYAENAASVSPIASELRQVRVDSSDVGQFIKRVRGFGDYQSFLNYVAGLP